MHLGPLDIVLLGGLAIGSATDLWSGRIPNALTFPMMALGIAMNATLPSHWVGLVGCAAAFALHFPLFAGGIERGGDAKLMMGVGAVLGWSGMLEATTWMAVLYLPIGLAILAARGKLGNLVAVGKHLAAKARGEDPGPPPEQTWFVTGPVIAISSVLAWSTDWLRFFG
jgi:Flp pilus assembly protein protease CpaA